ncbi:MAG: tetratricopeptide repeat protein [Thermodesulfovibrionales bacterium]
MYIDLNRKKILIIDDFRDFRKAMKNMMESLGATGIEEAATGEVAIEKIAATSYDIILCDYNLGEGRKDGQQVLEDAKYRGLIKYSSIFIMCTAENTMNMVMGAIEYQPDEYLVKPFSKEMLLNRLEKVVKKKMDFGDIEQAMQRKDYLRAISLCDRRLAENIRNRFEYLRLKGDLLLNIGVYDKAVSLYADVIAIRDLPWARAGLGKAYFLSGNFEDAREIFQSVVDENVTYMEAYDWLARTLEELHELKEAQEVLMAAAQISPKSILRQKALGDISYRNQDYDTSEKSFKIAVTLGKNSYLRSPAEYTGLAKALVEKQSGDEALNVLHSIKTEFQDDDSAALQAAIGQGIVYQMMGREEESRKAVAEATHLFESLPALVPAEVVMEFATACFRIGDTGRGSQLMKELVRNHHDDEKLISKIQGIFTDMKLSEEGTSIINATRQEIVRINNQGVRLVEEGRLKEAIDYFEKAADGLPDNKIIIGNAAQTLLLYMQKNGRDDHYLMLAGHYLAQIRRIDPAYQKLPKLLELYRATEGVNT